MSAQSPIHKELARLEFINDQLITELRYINSLLYAIGFPDGLSTVKIIAQEVLAEDGFQDF